MGTEVLRPQNCLREPQAAMVFHRRKTGNGYYNNYGYRKPVVRTEKKKLNNKSQNQNKAEPLISRRSSADGGNVTILRRGDSLDSLNPKIGTDKKKPEFTVYGTGRLGPEAPKQIRVGFSPADMYAGSAAFSNSPSPRSLPLPSFFNSKKQVEFKSFDDSATRDLRRLLRLE
ncbi:PREDICTED: uncharacterized protein LOC109232558 [Nicotiana attenuata]|uniref:Uncharacterized protein n=1 Tax=Nicotiana attenuata TaxID=49451 RepID=A0A1J6I0D4_NICAT|nr:PREDICTED: uncharacterized protein LOC109232558 [Nicotiana attenuata]OIS98549.1 hypothetical protein A4A49_18589 [Nicotiana attenuata]